MFSKVKQLNLKFISKTFVLAGLFLLVFSSIYKPLISRFSVSDSYYSHGFMIPFICLYLIWAKRSRLKSIEIKPSSFGIIFIVGGLLFHTVGVFLKINFVSYFSLPVVLYGISLFLGGKKITKELLFPIIFLVFMLPLPRVMIIGILFKMKLMVAASATSIVKSMGLDVWRIGSKMIYPRGYLIVGDPCSGLRSLISFLALGALFTQFTKAKPWQRLTLFACSVPIAFLSNLVRIVLLTVVSYVYGEKVALGFFHDFTGIMVFVLGFFLLMGASKVLRCQLTTEIT